VTYLLLLIVGTALVLAGLFVAGTLFLQGYLYSEPVHGIAWRGSAAGAAVAVFVGVWLLLAKSAPDGRYRTLLEFSPRDSTQFEVLSVPISERDDRRIVYKWVRVEGRFEYRRDGRPGPDTAWRARPIAIYAKEGDDEVKFVPDRDAKGNFKTEPNQPLLYRDARGRVMAEDYPGRLEMYRWGQFFVNVLLNVAFLAVLFAALFFLLEFQFWHAFGLTWVMWGVLVLFVLPPMLTFAESLGKG